ncbi:choline kinase [Legionella lansingensis]|uniref:Choline kinase n=1 Tax=Legionella lansingensis TaxID=45067 RepID=A0A0W0VFF0_9GAMM|nr:phosphotransferase [Legionella lansingensis]KTD18818.1 choline kinase [Legionella lansingensis]SNV43338.1 choline kinase [Legionella lansingensis]
MKLFFFGEGNPALPQRLCIYILSLAEEKDLCCFSSVNKTWKDTVETTKRNQTLLPYMKRIPQLTVYNLGQLGIYAMPGGMTNSTFKIRLKKQTQWVLRIPGKGSSVFLERSDEFHNARQAAELELNVIIDFFDPQDGLQLTRYLANNRPLLEELKTNPLILKTVVAVLKSLHNSTPFHNSVNVFSRNTKLLETLKITRPDILSHEIVSIEEKMGEIERLINCYQIERSPCHNDTTPGNFLVTADKKVKLLDWEYSANNDKVLDIVYLLWEAKLPREQVEILISSYFGKCDDKLLAWFEVYKPVIGWWYTIWSWTQIANTANACGLDDYQKLSILSYEATQECLATNAFKDAFSLLQSETQQPTFTHLRGF